MFVCVYAPGSLLSSNSELVQSNQFISELRWTASLPMSTKKATKVTLDIQATIFLWSDTLLLLTVKTLKVTCSGFLKTHGNYEDPNIGSRRRQPDLHFKASFILIFMGHLTLEFPQAGVDPVFALKGHESYLNSRGQGNHGRRAKLLVEFWPPQPRFPGQVDLGSSPVLEPRSTCPINLGSHFDAALWSHFFQVGISVVYLCLSFSPF